MTDRSASGALPATLRTGFGEERCKQPLGEKVFANWRENIEKDNLFVSHGGAMPETRREVKNVARRSDSFLAFNKKTNPALYDNRHLLMRMRVLRRDEVRRKAEATDHQIVAHNHFP